MNIDNKYYKINMKIDNKNIVEISRRFKGEYIFKTEYCILYPELHKYFYPSLYKEYYEEYKNIRK